MNPKNDGDDLPVLIVGGGLGGVATSLALGLQGRRVKLLEQSAEIAPLGYGVQIGPNVLPMLAKLGVESEVRKAAYLPDDLSLFDAVTGENLFCIPLKGRAFEQRYSAPYLCIHRVDLHEILLRALRKIPNIDLNQSTTVAGYSQTADSVRIQTEDGAVIEGQALVAADGLRSRLRAQMHPADTSRDTGYFAHRTILPMAEAPASLCQRKGVTMWTGDGFHVIFYPLRNRTEMNIVAVFGAPSGAAPGDDGAYRRRVEQIARNSRPEVADVISVVNLDRRWAIADRNPTKHWADGRVTLVGDAAHATLQSLAQGAGMAIEDAVSLSAWMGSHRNDPATAFAMFGRQRFLRTARVQLESRALWHTYHCSGADAEVRDQQFRERTADDFYRCLDWLWKAEAMAPSVRRDRVAQAA